MENHVCSYDENRKQLLRSLVDLCYRSGDTHLKSSLSCLPAVATIVRDAIAPTFSCLPQDRNDLILSKGHAASALYIALASVGLVSETDLREYLTSGGALQAHPKRIDEIGIRLSTGSLGQGLSFGVGLAYAKSKACGTGWTFVLLGDGECYEGQVHEALICADKLDVGRLCILIDNNHCTYEQRLTAHEEIVLFKSFVGRPGWFELRGKMAAVHSLTDILPSLLPEETRRVICILESSLGLGVRGLVNSLSCRAVEYSFLRSDEWLRCR